MRVVVIFPSLCGMWQVLLSLRINLLVTNSFPFFAQETRFVYLKKKLFLAYMRSF